LPRPTGERDEAPVKTRGMIRTPDELRAVMGEPNDVVVRKTLSALDRHCRTFIARSPFVVLSTADARGRQDVSPRGDPVGFVQILDATTLAIPDRLGNRRADSMENILQNPRVGLIFLIPGKTETLRVSGTAAITSDPELLASMAVRDRTPQLAIVVRVEEAFFHCSKALIRSGLWDSEKWPDLDGLPTLAETMVDAGKLELTNEEMHERVLRDERVRLY
jgi:PPOX class probable FMN-dependent enzyme